MPLDKPNLIPNLTLSKPYIIVNSQVVELGNSVVVATYSAPTLGSTPIASGATVTTIAGLTLSGATLSGAVVASGTINLSSTNGVGDIQDQFSLLLMSAI